MRLRCLLIILTFSFSFPRLSAQITGDSIPCYGSQQVYSLSSDDGYVFWSVTGGNISNPLGVSLLGANQFEVQWAHTGAFIVSCIYTDGFGLIDTAYDTIHVQPLPSPLIKALNSQSSCQYVPIVPAKDGSTQTTTCYSVCDSGWYGYAAKGWSGSTFSWTTPGSNLIVTNTPKDTAHVDWTAPLPMPNTILDNTGLTLIETSSVGCKDSTTICIGVNGKPHACFSSSPGDSAGVIRICANSTVTFSDSCTWVLNGFLIRERLWIEPGFLAMARLQ